MLGILIMYGFLLQNEDLNNNHSPVLDGSLLHYVFSEAYWGRGKRQRRKSLAMLTYLIGKGKKRYPLETII